MPTGAAAGRSSPGSMGGVGTFQKVLPFSLAASAPALQADSGPQDILWFLETNFHLHLSFKSFPLRGTFSPLLQPLRPTSPRIYAHPSSTLVFQERTPMLGLSPRTLIRWPVGDPDLSPQISCGCLGSGNPLLGAQYRTLNHTFLNTCFCSMIVPHVTRPACGCWVLTGKGVEPSICLDLSAWPYVCSEFWGPSPAPRQKVRSLLPTRILPLPVLGAGISSDPYPLRPSFAPTPVCQVLPSPVTPPYKRKHPSPNS